MYKIIGSDDKEYGPITADVLKQWIAQGRINGQTLVLPEGATVWQALGTIPELAAALPLMPPAPGPPPATATDLEAVIRQVRGPAIFILVLAILDVLTALIGIAMTAFQTSMPTIFNFPGQDPQLQRQLAFFFTLPANLIGLGLSLFCLIGALRMMKLKSYGLAMAVAIVTLIPCGTCCCLANLGAGIWALIVLSKPEVKAAFR